MFSGMEKSRQLVDVVCEVERRYERVVLLEGEGRVYTSLFHFD